MTFWRRVRRGAKSNARRLLQLIAAGPTRRARVLTYHSVDHSGSLISVTPDELRGQLRLLRDMGIRGLTAAEFTEHKLNPEKLSTGRVVLLTFDDGYENFLLDAVPLLKEFGFPATVFVVPQLMGKTACWYERDATAISNLVTRLTRSTAETNRYLDQMRPLASARLMTWEQTAQIVAAGFDVSSHSEEHRFLTSLSDEQIASDLLKSREAIRERLQVPADMICYPYGDCDERVARIAQKVGYQIGFRVDPSSDDDHLQLGRWSVGPGQTPREFRYPFSRASDVEEKLRNWVVS